MKRRLQWWANVLLKIFLLLITLFNPLIQPSIASSNWQKYPGNPVLNIGQAGSWDSRGAMSSSVLFNGNIYKMWYSGYDGSSWKIGYATSNDGINWTKPIPTPLISPNYALDGEIDAVNPFVLFDGNIYKMWYTSARSYSGSGNEVYRIGYTTSSDGINWDPNRQLILRA